LLIEAQAAMKVKETINHCLRSFGVKTQKMKNKITHLCIFMTVHTGWPKK